MVYEIGNHVCLFSSVPRNQLARLLLYFIFAFIAKKGYCLDNLRVMLSEPLLPERIDLPSVICHAKKKFPMLNLTLNPDPKP